MSAVFHGPGEGVHHQLGPSAEVTVKAGGEQTGGTLFLGEFVLGAGAPGPPLHRHATMHDLFYVLEGALTVRLEAEEREAGPGSFACVPPGVAHTVSNSGSQPVRFLNFSTPSGFEHYMRELAEVAGDGPPAPAAIAAVAARYDIDLV